jgi:hypothetical protein
VLIHNRIAQHAHIEIEALLPGSILRVQRAFEQHVLALYCVHNSGMTATEIQPLIVAARQDLATCTRMPSAWSAWILGDLNLDTAWHR